MHSLWGGTVLGMAVSLWGGTVSVWHTLGYHNVWDGTVSGWHSLWGGIVSSGMTQPPGGSMGDWM